jgi:hypothetical protein
MAAEAMDPMDEVARLLALNLKRERGLQDVIAELDGIGIRPVRIAQLLGTSPAYVGVALGRIKKQATKDAKARNRTGTKT